MDGEALRQRCGKFLEESDMPIARMCRKLNLSTTAFYKWRGSELNLTDKRLEDIDKYLTKFGY